MPRGAQERSGSRGRWRAFLALLLLIAIAPCRSAAEPSDAAPTSDINEDVLCPFEYERHTVSQVLSGQKRPWIWVSS